eukprot:TRINITY_DN389_c0_g1_i6.p2 TRINITY_DN389_c0_g1~~TRINITY_DN389_c0_g1_i6.p2  ORF type:complete len:151 (+),score=29.92 TRINITY_DN389_c0_g1_i6:634-1086(+)
MEDWYNISRAQIEKYEDGKKMISKFKRLCFALQFAFPDYPWNVQKFSKKLKKSSQRWLLLTLKNIYTHGDCFLEDHVLYYDLIPVELDIYLPNLQLAFEYQGLFIFPLTQTFDKVNSTTTIWKEFLEKLIHLGVFYSGITKKKNAATNLE